VDQSAFLNGRWAARHRLNGDENGHGTSLRLSGGMSCNGSTQRVKLYR